MQRRSFLKISLAAASVLLTNSIKLSAKSLEENKSTVLILGGGFAGLSTAKYLKELNPKLNVTVVEKILFLSLVLFLMLGWERLKELIMSLYVLIITLQL